MTYRWCTTLVVAGLALAGCHTVQTKFDRQADFSTYATFGWRCHERPSPADRLFPELVAEAQRSANDNLTAKGLTPTNLEQADLLLDYHLEIGAYSQDAGISKATV